MGEDDCADDDDDDEDDEEAPQAPHDEFNDDLHGGEDDDVDVSDGVISSEGDISEDDH